MASLSARSEGSVNLTYNLWRFGELTLLVRCRIHAAVPERTAPTVCVFPSGKTPSFTPSISDFPIEHTNTAQRGNGQPCGSRRARPPTPYHAARA